MRQTTGCFLLSEVKCATTMHEVGKGQFWRVTLACAWLVVDIVNVIRYGAAAMRL